MQILILIALIALVGSFFADRQKTWQGIKEGLAMFVKILPAIVAVLALVSVTLYFLPEKLIVKHLGEEAGFMGLLLAAVTGSMALIPGFIAYPLSGFLVNTGVSYPVIAVFITTLMMVGILTLPVEIRFFGLKVSLMRNALFFVGALVIGLLIGLFYMA